MENGQMIWLQFSKAAAFVGHTHYIIGVTAPALIVARLLGWKSLAKFSWPDVFSFFQQLYQHLCWQRKTVQDNKKITKIGMSDMSVLRHLISTSETLDWNETRIHPHLWAVARWVGTPGWPWGTLNSGIEFIDHPLAFAGLELRPTETCSQFGSRSWLL